MKKLVAVLAAVLVTSSLFLAFPFLSEQKALDMNVSVMSSDSVGSQAYRMTLKVENLGDEEIDPVFMPVPHRSPMLWNSNVSEPLEPGETRIVAINSSSHSNLVPAEREFLLQVIDRGTQKKYKQVLRLEEREVPSYVYKVGELEEWSRTVLKSDKINLSMEFSGKGIDLKLANTGNTGCGVKYVSRIPPATEFQHTSVPLEIKLFFGSPNKSREEVRKNVVREHEKVIVAEPGETVSARIDIYRIFRHFNESEEKMSITELEFVKREEVCAGEIAAHVEPMRK